VDCGLAYLAGSGFYLKPISGNEQSTQKIVAQINGG